MPSMKGIGEEGADGAASAHKPTSVTSKFVHELSAHLHLSLTAILHPLRI